MAFTQRRSRNIPAMQAEVQEYEDPVSGARHIHLATDNPEMVFLVGFPTVPDRSDGRAHILEHLALCGSARYPVRDPFFAMTRRSVAHFMNAMTYPDKTVYPFASTDKTDFFNLLDVYLDAAFFPRLDYLDFRQEGWRLALDGDKLAYHGIVFNEMKGAFADPVRALESGICAQLLEGTTYAVESGGDPLDIPSLSYEALKEFHASHYHPSQAVFMTAGALDPREVQQMIEERVLSRLPGRAARLLPQMAATWPAPRQAVVPVPVRDHGVQIAWLLGESVDPLAYYEAELLESGLLSNAAAPLSQAMESAGYGRPSALNGSDAGGRQIVFHLGMEGLTEEQVPKARKRIWAALEKAARDGVPQSVLQATLRDIRFRQREIKSGSTPNALWRLLQAMPYEMYGGDIMHGFDFEDVLEQLQQKIADPAFFKGLVQALLDAPTRLDVTALPDPDYFQKRKKTEDERLAALQAGMTETEKERLRAESAALLERQRQQVNNDVLPRIRPQDVHALPRPAFPLPPVQQDVVGVSIASNGISYARVMYDVSAFGEADWPWLQLYVEVAPELGVGDRSYEEADAWRHARVPFFDINLQTAQAHDDRDSLRAHVDFYAKGLREEHGAMAEILSESIRATRFDEYERLAFLIDSKVEDIRNDLADEGDDYAKYTAIAPLSSMRRFEDRTKGVSSLPFRRELHRQSQTPEGIREISRRLEDLHRRILGCPRLVLTAGGGQDAEELAGLIKLPELAPAATGAPAPAAEQALSNTALHAAAQVNHCIAAWPAPAYSDPDAPVLAVLAELLTNLVLHQALREEGGAYGGYAFYSSASAVFAMSSYRDPRLAETFAAFEQAIERVLAAELKQENIEEAIICVVQSLDKPRTPYAEVLASWDDRQQGITEEMRRHFRHGVLHCTAEQLKAAVERWLRGKPYSRAAFVGQAEQDLAGMALVRLEDLIG
jgi:hypothetical protein